MNLPLKSSGFNTILSKALPIASMVSVLSLEMTLSLEEWDGTKLTKTVAGLVEFKFGSMVIFKTSLLPVSDSIKTAHNTICYQPRMIELPPDATYILLAPEDSKVTSFSWAHICWTCNDVRKGSSENHMLGKMKFLIPFLVKFNAGDGNCISKQVKTPKVPLSVSKVTSSGVSVLFTPTSPYKFHFLYLDKDYEHTVLV